MGLLNRVVRGLLQNTAKVETDRVRLWHWLALGGMVVAGVAFYLLYHLVWRVTLADSIQLLRLPVEEARCVTRKVNQAWATGSVNLNGTVFLYVVTGGNNNTWDQVRDISRLYSEGMFTYFTPDEVVASQHKYPGELILYEDPANSAWASVLVFVNGHNPVPQNVTYLSVSDTVVTYTVGSGGPVQTILGSGNKSFMTDLPGFLETLYLPMYCQVVVGLSYTELFSFFVSWFTLSLIVARSLVAAGSRANNPSSAATEPDSTPLLEGTRADA